MSTYNRLLTGGASAAALFTKLFPPSVRSNVASSNIRRGVLGCHASAAAYPDHSVPRVCSDMFIPVALPRCMPHQPPHPHTAPSMGVGVPIATRKAWNAMENNESLTFRFDMPGLDKDKVKVRVEDDTFFIEAEPVKEFEEDEEEEMPPPSQGYFGRFDLPVGGYKMKEIRAEINNGVMKVFVPKVERKLDVWEVEVK